MKYYITILIAIIIALGAFGFYSGWFGTQESVQPATTTPTGATTSPDGVIPDDTSGTSTADDDVDQDDSQTVIGQSVDGRDITAYHFGGGQQELLLVAGIHGGYEWNTTKLGYRMVDWLGNNESAIPQNLQVTVVPVLNPDGLVEVVGTADNSFSEADVPGRGATIPGRFNSNGVDLNRNFACNWQSEGQWQDRSVDAGSSAFSEPESQALRDYVQSNDITASVVYYSAAGGVYTSSCNSEPLAETTQLMNTYANASGYPAAGEFDAYPITGDAVDWMAKQDISAVSVLLSNHSDIEWSKNRSGIQAILEQYAQ